MYLISLLNGMDYNLSAIPPEFPAPASSSEFDRQAMTAMFDEGYRLAASGSAWRKTPPGVEPGESPLGRWGTALTHQPRGPASGLVLDEEGRPVGFPVAPVSIAPGPLPVPVYPGMTVTR